MMRRQLWWRPRKCSPSKAKSLPICRRKTVSIFEWRTAKQERGVGHRSCLSPSNRLVSSFAAMTTLLSAATNVLLFITINQPTESLPCQKTLVLLQRPTMWWQLLRRAAMRWDYNWEKLFTEALADMCAVGMCPLPILKGSFFRNYAQTVLNIGVSSKVGMSIDNIPPDPTSIRRNVQIRSGAGHELMTSTQDAHMAEGIRIGSTTDNSTDDINKGSLLSAPAHLIDDGFTLHHRTMACSLFPEQHHGPDFQKN